MSKHKRNPRVSQAQERIMVQQTEAYYSNRPSESVLDDFERLANRSDINVVKKGIIKSLIQTLALDIKKKEGEPDFTPMSYYLYALKELAGLKQIKNRLTDEELDTCIRAALVRAGYTTVEDLQPPAVLDEAHMLQQQPVAPLPTTDSHDRPADGAGSDAPPAPRQSTWGMIKASWPEMAFWQKLVVAAGFPLVFVFIWLVKTINDRKQPEAVK